jgi:hypothetical protein
MKVKTDLLLCSFAVFYIVLMFSPGLMILTGIISVAAYALYKSTTHVLGILIGMIILQILTVALKPVTVQKVVVLKPTMEGFQVKDPVSIHQRIATNKGQPPLEPKVENITGVLESPRILDSLQIAALNKGDQGGTNSTLPASLNGIPSIKTPREEEIVKNTYDNLHPRGNPFLQNGSDDGAVNTALSGRGSDLKIDQAAGNMPGTSIGHGSV